MIVFLVILVVVLALALLYEKLEPIVDDAEDGIYIWYNWKRDRKYIKLWKFNQ